MDTLAISRRLREAGLDQPAAEAITSAIRDAVDSQAASKADLDAATAKLEARSERLEQKIDSQVQRLEQKLDSQVERLEQKVETRVQQLELKLTWWIIGAGGLFALLQIAARYLLPAP